MTRPLTDFEQEYLGRWTQPEQCQVAQVRRGSQPPGERCPEEAKFALTRRDETFKVCERCVGSQVIALAYATGVPVTVERLRR